MPRPRLPRSLRTQVTLSAALIALLIVGASGAVIAVRIHDQDLAQVDQDLQARAAKVAVDAGKVLSNPDQNKSGAAAARNDSGLLTGSQSVVRVLSGDTVVSQHGDTPAGPVPPPGGAGYRTVVIGDQQWRSLVVPIPGGEVQVLDSLAPVEQRFDDNARVIAAVTLVATLLTSFGVWLIAGIVMAPLQTLRAGVSRIRSGHDLERRLPPVSRPLEVADLSRTLNDMLAGLQSSMLATRRFTADAGHELRTPLTSLGIDLESLRRNPDLPAATRASMLDAMTVEHAHIVSLLDGLQSLARGDAGALPPVSEIDVADLVQDCVTRAGRRHPDVHFHYTPQPGRAPVVEGWPQGLRIAVGNLLTNAAVHGRAGGNVEAAVSAPDGETVVVTIADDGPGIPAERRDAMRQRFVRGAHPRSRGSGLGLALTDQQVALHGGTLELDDAPTGGLLAVITLPAEP